MQSKTDAILGWVDKATGRPFVMDTWIENYNAPSIDKTRQNYENLSGRIENGETILEFSRKRSTNDEYDFSFTNEQCLHLMYIVKGGSFNGINKKIRKHEQLPIVSAQKICIINNGGAFLF